jgi:hypothetical protein
MPNKQFIAISTLFIFILTACSSSKPSESEIRAALAERINQKGCATSILLETIPIKQERIANNQTTLNALVSVGLLEKTGNNYTLTKLGQSAYDVKIKGFCYTERYEINDIAVVKEEGKSTLSGAWYISFTITPNKVSDWAKNPQLLQVASNASLEEISGSQKYTVRFARKAGEDKVILADSKFTFQPGFHFNMSW